jgi:hypothetical protein
MSLVLPGVANALLVDRGGGLIYDDVLDITWLQDANYAFTSGYAADNAVDNGGAATNNIFTDGRMGWDAANTWADGLSYYDSVRDVTYTDWRLPDTLQPDPSCDSSFDAGVPYGVQSYGYYCTGSEMGYLFYTDLGGSAGSSIASVHNGNYDLFSNVQSNVYWSGLEYAPSPSGAWAFYFGDGTQGTGNKSNEFFAWAVRPGDVAATVPAPGTLVLIALGLAGLRGVRGGRRHSVLR